MRCEVNIQHNIRPNNKTLIISRQGHLRHHTGKNEIKNAITCFIKYPSVHITLRLRSTGYDRAGGIEPKWKSQCNYNGCFLSNHSSHIKFINFSKVHLINLWGVECVMLQQLNILTSKDLAARLILRWKRKSWPT